MTLGGMFTVDNTELTSEHLGQVDEKMGKVNVLLLGVDKEGLRTDTIIVASFDTDDNTVNMLSIPRDTRMYIGSRYQKINAAHALSKKNGKITGPEGTIEAVTRLTGIPINYYIEFSFDAFRDTVDALGGVYFDVPQNMNYEDPVQDLYIHLKKGYQLLDGDKAEQLIRFRRYVDGDLGRIKVQQDFLHALIEQKLKVKYVGKVGSIYKIIARNMETSMTPDDFVQGASQVLDIGGDNVNTYTLPNVPQYIDRVSYVVPVTSEIKKIREEVFGYDESGNEIPVSSSQPEAAIE
jgi:LCP family protein required for cell wall assembly